MTLHRFGTALLVSIMFLAGCQADNSRALTINGAWIRAAPPNAPAMAGYMRIRNNGDQPRRLLSVKSPAFGAVELHRSVIKNGVAHMIRQDAVTIPAHGSAAFKPGGYHLMMMEPSKAYHTGTTLTATLTFDNNASRTLEMPVKKTAPQD